ncbi:MAG: MlaD family protein [Kiritimatiellaeota bacterium]|nr:MlaD family protein [Kiritimatiellota bacterium]
MLVFAALFAFTVVISGSAFFKKGETVITVVLPDAMGLRRNDPVIAKGTSVGVVEEVYYDRDGVHVIAKLSAPVTFYEGYKITVGTTSILGGRQLLLTEGNPDAPKVADITNLTGLPPANMMDDATAVVNELRTFLEGDFLPNLTAISSNLVAVTERVERGEGTVGKLLSADNTLYDTLETIVNDIAAVTRRIEHGEGMIGKLLSSDTELYDNLNAAVADIATIASRIEQGEGTLGKLLSEDAELYDNLNAAVADIADIAARLKQGEGTMGKLLSDPALYDNVNGVATDARELIDDIRETTPVSTFSTFMLGVF